MDAVSAPDINARIARAVRAARAARGLSLDGLAARSGVSRSMLSRVERGESSPTATVLEKVATGLGLPLARLFDDPGEPAGPLARRAQHAAWRDPASGYVRRNVSPPNFPSPIRIVDVTLPGRARVAFDTGARAEEVHQQIWVRSGRVDFTLGPVTYRLEADDCLALRLDAPTAFRNPGRAPARYVVVLSSGPARGRR